jgi:protein-S-isoprenylcysteine O-methyltransferase Ste14
VPDWIPDSWTLLLPGSALWALALYIPLSAPLSRMEESLASTSLTEDSRQAVLVVASLLLALVVGVGVNLVLGWALGPGWGTSLGLMAALYGLFWGLAASRDRGD